MAARRRSSAWSTRSCSPARSPSPASTILHLPEGVQTRMAEIAATLMQGLGFDNGIFNIEMMYDAEADRISIIEINPRMASQFADLYEKVDGTSSYSVLLDIAQGGRPASRAGRGATLCRELRLAQLRGLSGGRRAQRGRYRASRAASIRISGSSCMPRPGASSPTNSRTEKLSLWRRQSRRTRPRRRARAVRGVPGALGIELLPIERARRPRTNPAQPSTRRITRAAEERRPPPPE